MVTLVVVVVVVLVVVVVVVVVVVLVRITITVKIMASQFDRASAPFPGEAGESLQTCAVALKEPGTLQERESDRVFRF